MRQIIGWQCLVVTHRSWFSSWVRSVFKALEGGMVLCGGIFRIWRYGEDKA